MTCIGLGCSVAPLASECLGVGFNDVPHHVDGADAAVGITKLPSVGSSLPTYVLPVLGVRM